MIKMWKRLLANKKRVSVEPNSGVPHSASLGIKKPLTLEEHVLRVIKSQEFARSAKSEGFDTFEENEDFDVGHPDYPDLSSRYDLVHDDDVGREVTRTEALMMAEARKQFDAMYEKKRREALQNRRKPPVKEEVPPKKEGAS